MPASRCPISTGQCGSTRMCSGARWLASPTRRPTGYATFFGVDADQPACKIGWIRVPGGGVLEIFEFKPHRPAEPVPGTAWASRTSPSTSEDTQKWYDYLVSKGVECLGRPERSPRGHTFFFAKDFDGNLIEIMDLGHMYHVLKWLGPLGGWLFRRGRYKQVPTKVESKNTELKVKLAAASSTSNFSLCTFSLQLHRYPDPKCRRVAVRRVSRHPPRRLLLNASNDDRCRTSFSPKLALLSCRSDVSVRLTP